MNIYRLLKEKLNQPLYYFFSCNARYLHVRKHDFQRKIFFFFIPFIFQMLNYNRRNRKIFTFVLFDLVCLFIYTFIEQNKKKTKRKIYLRPIFLFSSIFFLTTSMFRSCQVLFRSLIGRLPTYLPRKDNKKIEF